MPIAVYIIIYLFKLKGMSTDTTNGNTGSKDEVPLPPFSPQVETALKAGKAGEYMDRVNK